ncbi:MAG: protein kinase [Lachnospiraceae bacterium]|nr:protein kinase [Lachnospiraceae bacterium]
MHNYKFNDETKELFINGNKIEIPKYKFISKISHGKNGIVIKSIDPLLNRQVAVKIWLPRENFSYPDKDRFYHEIRKIAQLNSSKIVQIYDADIVNKNYFYAVFELVNGISLNKWLDNGQPLVYRYNILSQIYKEIKQVHEMNIYHGDLHGENILIDNNMNVKILDFGTSYFERKRGTIKNSHKREARLLLKTGLSLLKEETNKYHLLSDVVLSNNLPPELIPEILLILNELIWNIESRSNLLEDENKTHIAFLFSYRICEIPFFNLMNVIKVIREIVLEDEYIEWFIASVFSQCMDHIYNENIPIKRVKLSKNNIRLLYGAYVIWRVEYIKRYTQNSNSP